MGRLTTSFVLGYHGCDAEVAREAVNRGTPILQSDRAYDWLGPGAYFWESDPTRAMEWARWKVERGEYSQPAVVGAIIDLRNCLDLTNREDVDLVSHAYDSFAQLQDRAGLPLPTNKSVNGDPNEDLLLHFLDCAAFRHLHQLVAKAGMEPFDTIRGVFTEGDRAFPGSEIRQKTHTQIAVRSNDCIKGLFYPLEDGVIQFAAET